MLIRLSLSPLVQELFICMERTNKLVVAGQASTVVPMILSCIVDSSLQIVLKLRGKGIVCVSSLPSSFVGFLQVLCLEKIHFVALARFRHPSILLANC